MTCHQKSFRTTIATYPISSASSSRSLPKRKARSSPLQQVTRARKAKNTFSRLYSTCASYAIRLLMPSHQSTKTTKQSNKFSPSKEHLYEIRLTHQNSRPYE